MNLTGDTDIPNDVVPLTPADEVVEEARRVHNWLCNVQGRNDVGLGGAIQSYDDWRAGTPVPTKEATDVQ